MSAFMGWWSLVLLYLQDALAVMSDVYLFIFFKILQYYDQALQQHMGVFSPLLENKMSSHVP